MAKRLSSLRAIAFCASVLMSTPALAQEGFPADTPSVVSAQDGQAESEDKIVVNVSRIGNGNGRVGCALYLNEDGFPAKNEKAHKTMWATINSSEAVCEFDGIEPGTYAVSVFHDEDMNGKLNTKFLGRPAEGWGVSNNVSAGTFGPPGYDEASFQYTGNTMHISIELIEP
jgi:uncharacterized protein (DUF2141 family)